MARKASPARIDEVRTFPVFPLRRSLVLPFLRVPLLLTRPVSVQAAEKAMQDGPQLVAVFNQLGETDIPQFESDFAQCGVLVKIHDFQALPNGFAKLMVEGVDSVRALAIRQVGQMWLADCTPIRRALASTIDSQRYLQQFREIISALPEDNPVIPPEVRETLLGVQLLTELCYRIFPLLDPTPEVIPAYVDSASEVELAERTLALLDSMLEARSVVQNAERKAQRVMDRTHREWQISQRIKALQEELDNPLEAERDPELRRFEQRLRDAKIPPAVKEKAQAELTRLMGMRDNGPEAGVLRNWLDWTLGLPWGQSAPDRIDIARIRKTLDAEHTGLEKVKERILEHAAVLSLVEDRSHSPILCLVGPPGVGKTTLVRSIADALERPLIRITLGGVRDEAEIRGHRRTYIGSMPGRIIQALRKAKVMNPVILLDELDKMSSDFRGDPASALLEVLDPEQNKEFQDHFMDLGVNLGQILFIATANAEEQIPHALHDRFEVVRLSGYHRHEKHAIVKNHLLSKVAKHNGLELSRINLTDDALNAVLDGYTREAGVRELERQLDRIARKRALESLTGRKGATTAIKASDVAKYLGVALFQGQTLPQAQPGIIMGLAYTSTGGDILPIECVLLSGRGRLNLTGKLGEVMKESAQIALTLVRQRAKRYGVDPDIFRHTDIHIHVPEGATPKEGPSAGIALTLALLSAFTRQVVPSSIAFTGEVSLTGQLHAIGGLAEKSLAALRNGVTQLHVPEGNRRHISELPEPVRQGLKIDTHAHLDDILKVLFVKVPGASSQVTKSVSAKVVKPTLRKKSV